MERKRSDKLRPDGKPRAIPRRAGEPRRPWNPEHAALIPWYPKTPEAYAVWTEKARQRMLDMHAKGKKPNRSGIPNGYGGKKHIVLAIRAKAQAEAKQMVTYMKNKGMVAEDGRAEEALEAMIGVVRAYDEDLKAPLYPVSSRIQAAKVVLEFTKQKPASKVEATVTKAEDFLAAVAADMKADDTSE